MKKKGMMSPDQSQNPVIFEKGRGKDPQSPGFSRNSEAGGQTAAGRFAPGILTARFRAHPQTNLGWVWALIAGLLIMAFPACATPPAVEDAPAEAVVPAPPPETEPSERPEYAEPRPRALVRDELTVALSKGDAVELDFRKSYLASEAQVFTGIYEGLFSYHPFTMEPIPALAARWVISEDKKQWTFTIRENARYWNGDPVQAEDFRRAWISLLDPVKESPYSSLFDIIEGARDFRTGRLQDPARVGIRAEAPKTLVVRLNSPAAFFPSMLCHHSFSPIHSSMMEVEDWTGMSPISNGPFYILEHQEEAVVLAKNPHYWEANRVSLNRIILRYTEDGDKAASLWNSGEARWISGEVNLENLTDRSGIVVNPLFATHYYFIRSARAPWNDYRIRQALSLVLPWAQIREGYYLPAKTLIYPIPGYPEIDGLDTTDVEEARRLLAEAGFPEGKGLPELVIRLNPSTDAARVGRLMAAAWMEELGVKVKIEVVPYGQYFQALKQNDYEVGFSTWIGDFADPYTFLQMWRRDSNLNDARHDDLDYENLMEESMAEEGEKRWQILSKAEELLLERGTVLPIFYSPALNVVDVDELDGWFPNVLDIHPFKYLSFKTFRPLPGVAKNNEEFKGPLNTSPFLCYSLL
ncbi:MAG: peptide ABC transporter substrate-binding protein [Spirochaetaceae bacterium]|jgi:peptide/nickel transport system substrate-binding protein/oligopeptide transport system substrate-binding protein|nr:peptide ABC transporter substrate-binding protein [Spirochaetaceae bacterium]